jgi:hypothetical protein
MFSKCFFSPFYRSEGNREAEKFVAVNGKSLRWAGGDLMNLAKFYQEIDGFGGVGRMKLIDLEADEAR